MCAHTLFNKNRYRLKNDYYGKEFVEMLDEEDLEELTSPVIIKNALVYAVREDDWFWKSAQ